MQIRSVVLIISVDENGKRYYLDPVISYIWQNNKKPDLKILIRNDLNITHHFISTALLDVECTEDGIDVFYGMLLPYYFASYFKGKYAWRPINDLSSQQKNLISKFLSECLV